MLILVIGCGSIGKRHIRNLKSMSVGEVIAYDTDDKQCSQVELEYGVKTYNDLESAFERKPQIAVICTPTNLHIPLSISAAKNDCHLFVEKPLSHTLNGIEDLIKVVKQKNLITLIGCNMRFHVGPRKVKEILNLGIIGKVLSARIETGSYLPGWRPQQNYKKTYSARENWGGGCVMDCIHEIDLALWYLDDVRSLYSVTKNLGVLDIDAEEISEIVCEFESGAIGSIHLDYISRTYERKNHIIGELGSIFWDFGKGSVEVYLADKDKWEEYKEPANYDINQMYVEELSYFISCVNENKETFNNVERAAKTLKFALAVKESSKLKKCISLDKG